MARSPRRPEPRILDARLIDHEVELVSGHDLAEVEVFGLRPSPLPVGPVGVAFPPEELLTSYVGWRVEQYEEVQVLVKFWPGTVGALAVSYTHLTLPTIYSV